jgi:polyhydroxyalkanoate synthesis regulator phasin
MTPNRNPLSEIAAGACAAMFLAEEVALRLVDVLVAKGILTKGEARSTLFAIADDIRTQSDGTSSMESIEVLAGDLERAAVSRYEA